MTTYRCPANKCFSVTGPVTDCDHARRGHDAPVLTLRLDPTDPDDRTELARQAGAKKLRAWHAALDRRAASEARFAREETIAHALRSERIACAALRARSYGAGLVPFVARWR